MYHDSKCMITGKIYMQQEIESYYQIIGQITGKSVHVSEYLQVMWNCRLPLTCLFSLSFSSLSSLSLPYLARLSVWRVKLFETYFNIFEKNWSNVIFIIHVCNWTIVNSTRSINILCNMWYKSQHYRLSMYRYDYWCMYLDFRKIYVIKQDRTCTSVYFVKHKYKI